MFSSSQAFYVLETLSNRHSLFSTLPIILQIFCPSAPRQRLISLLGTVDTTHALVELIEVSQAHHSETGAMCYSVCQPLIYEASCLPPAFIQQRWRDASRLDAKYDHIAEGAGSAGLWEGHAVVSLAEMGNGERGQTTQDNEALQQQQFLSKCQWWKTSLSDIYLLKNNTLLFKLLIWCNLNCLLRYISKGVVVVFNIAIDCTNC